MGGVVAGGTSLSAWRNVICPGAMCIYYKSGKSMCIYIYIYHADCVYSVNANMITIKHVLVDKCNYHRTGIAPQYRILEKTWMSCISFSIKRIEMGKSH